MVPPVVGESYNNHAHHIQVDAVPWCHDMQDDTYDSSSPHHRQFPSALSALSRMHHVQRPLIHPSMMVVPQSFRGGGGCNDIRAISSSKAAS